MAEDDENDEEAKEEDDEEEEEEDDDEDDADEAKTETSENPIAAAIPPTPLSITFKTNLGNSLVDTSLEVLVSRTRNIEAVKKIVARMLPGRPPVESIRILADGEVLDDDQLLDELVDDDDEVNDEDNDEEQNITITLTLDMVPPVDSKFATDVDQLDDMTTSELLDAYTANAAAMYYNGQTISSDQFEGSVTRKLRQQAHDLRHQLELSFSDTVMELLAEDTPPSARADSFVEDRRGQRVRSGLGGAKTNMRRVIQKNLNINWEETIRNFILFIFFGVFGGRSGISRNILLLGAPLCFALQARPMKIALKQLFYVCQNPPGIISSLLPAPQQSILNFDEHNAEQALYGIEIIQETGEVEELDNDQTDDDDDDDDEEEEEEEDDSDSDSDDDEDED